MKDTTTFLQSKNWADFQAAVGYVPMQVGTVYGYEKKIGPFRYLSIPRAAELTDTALESIQQAGFAWVRLDGTPVPKTDRKVVSVKNRQPQTTLIRSLGGTEEDILADMHKKTRYNIRLATKKGVQIKKEKNIDIFWQLHAQTTERDAFHGHTKEYYKKFLEMPMCEQFTAYYKDIPIASILTVLHNSTMTYVHGASASKHRTVMAPYALQWFAMQDGKKRGAKQYDFWGIAPIYSPNTIKKETCHNDFCWSVVHPWTGITRFKVGFGGTVVDYEQAADIVLSPIVYALYRILYRLKYGK